MARIFSPGRALQFTTWEKSGASLWGPIEQIPRGFGLGSVVDGEPTKYEHRWVMTAGLVEPARITAARRLVLQVALDSQYNPPVWQTDVIHTADWLAQMRVNWTAIEQIRSTPQQPIALEYVHSNSWGYTNKPTFTSDAPPFPPSSDPISERQIDVGPIGVYRGVDDDAPELMGDLYVVGSDQHRSEIWVVDGTYPAHVPPGGNGAERDHWIVLAPSPNFPPGTELAAQDFIDQAWELHGDHGQQSCMLVSATRSAAIPSCPPHPDGP